MRYILDKKVFFNKLNEAGYKSILDFSNKTGIHRNTINLYLHGSSVLTSSIEKIADVLKVDPMEMTIPVSDETTKIRDVESISKIIGYLAKYDSSMAIVLLGSRAKNKEKKYSDWDIGITRFGNAISGEEYLILKGKVEDLAEDITCNVDLINLDQAPKWFLESIDYEPVFLDGSRESYIHLKGVLDGVKRESAA